MSVLRVGSPEQAGMIPAQIELIRRRGEHWAQQDNTLGLQLLVARHGVVCLHEAWGHTAPAPEGHQISTDSYFLIASNSKLITATAVMMLVEDGLVGLTRPVNFYIPEFTAPGTEGILLQQLLTHTSGYDWDETSPQVAALLAAGMDLPPCPDNQDPTLHASLHALCRTSPAKKPGVQMSYANENYELLGEIVRRVSGMKFGDFLAERIFQPLGMDGVFLGLDPSIEADFVWDFTIPYMQDAPIGEEFREALRVPHPAGSIYGRAREFATFAQMLLNKGRYGEARILHPVTVAQMTRNQIPGIPAEFLSHQHAEAGWGYGPNMIETGRWPWFDGSLAPDGAFTHGGGGGTSFWVDPSRDLLGVYFSFCNTRDPITDDYMWDFDLFQNMVTAAVV